MTRGNTRPPGPRSAATFIPRFARDPFGALRAVSSRYGDVYRLPFGITTMTVVNHPDHVGHFLTSNAGNYRKGDMNRRLIPALGDGIPVSEGEKWRRNRKLMNPMFSRKALDGLAEIVAKSIDDSMQRWHALAQERSPRDIYPELGVVTMQVLQRAMFSSSVRDDEVPALVDSFRTVALYMGGLMGTAWAPTWLPVPYRRRGVPAVARVYGVIDAVIADRRAHPTDARDLLNLLLEARYEDTGEPIRDVDLRDEINGIFFGGFDTTGSALLWTLALLALNPEHAERARAEIESKSDDPRTMADVQAMPFTKACFDEAMRVQGALLLTRQAIDDDEIGGFHVPAGSLVGTSAYTLHRHPEFWDDPERFDPDRFLGERGASHHRYQFLPFGAGPRHCIGSNLAYLEGVFTLARMLRRFHITPAPGFVPRHKFHVSVGMHGGLPATVREREHRSVLVA